jgi:hypothetical protein
LDKAAIGSPIFLNVLFLGRDSTPNSNPVVSNQFPRHLQSPRRVSGRRRAMHELMIESKSSNAQHTSAVESGSSIRAAALIKSFDRTAAPLAVEVSI